MAWTSKSLNSPVIYEAMSNKGINPKSFFTRPRSGVICGLLLLATIGGTLPLLLKGETAEMAKSEARKQVGEGYKFSVSTISINPNYNGVTNVYAIVIAYSNSEIKKVEVQFEK